jgi:hypothetical protein
MSTNTRHGYLATHGKFPLLVNTSKLESDSALKQAPLHIQHDTSSAAYSMSSGINFAGECRRLVKVNVFINELLCIFIKAMRNTPEN